MAISFVGADSGGAQNVSDITNLAWPSGVASGDLALIWWMMVNTATPTTPSGFTQQDAIDGDSGSSRMRFYSKTCDGTETGGLTLTSGVMNRHSAVLIVYRRCHPASPLDTWAKRDENTVGTTHVNPEVTTGYPDCVIVTAIGERVITGTNAWTPPSGYAERADSEALGWLSGGSGSCTAGADDGLTVSRQPGTAVTPPVWTSGNSASTQNVITWTLSLRPADVPRPPLAVSSAAVHRAASW